MYSSTLLFGSAICVLAGVFFAKFMQGGSKISVRYERIPLISLISGTLVFLTTGFSFRKYFHYIGKFAPIVKIPSVPGLTREVLLINDLKLAKHIFSNPVFCGRPKEEMWSVHANGNYGLSMTEGPVWEEQKKFAISQFKQFGIGTKRMQEHIDIEIQDVLQLLSKGAGKLISPNHMFQIPALNLMWRFLVGHRVTDEPEVVQQAVDTLFTGAVATFKFPEIIIWATNWKVRTIMKLNSLFGFAPQISKLIRDIPGILRTHVCAKVSKIEEYLGDENSLPGCFAEAYLMEIRKNSKENIKSRSISEEEGRKHLEGNLADFIMAGGDTTANSLSWAVLHLIRNPEVQEKIYQEIVANIGTDRNPSLEDRQNCPYTEAFIYETLRVTPPVLGGVPHVAMEDAAAGNYLVKKGTMMVINKTAVNNDPRLWVKPEEFNPERFINTEGRCLRPENLISFSTGRRRCPGEQLAKDTMFLFITSICQKFLLSKNPKLDSQPLTSIHSAWHVPDTYYMLVEERHQHAPVVPSRQG